jgi:nitrogen-specific signal transduction histidine kinase
MDKYIIIVFINSLMALSLGSIVYNKNRNLKKYFLFNLSVFFFNFFYLLWFLFEKIIIFKLIMFSAAFIPFTFLFFSYDFSGKKIPRTLLIFNYVSLLLFACLSFTKLIIKGYYPILMFNLYPRAGSLFPLYALYFFVIIVVGHYVLIKNRIKSNNTILLAIGTLLGFVGGLSNFFLFYDIPFPPILNALMTIHVILVAFAITKYELLDIKVIIPRYLANIITIAATIASILVISSANISRSFLFLTNIILILFWGRYFNPIREKLQTAAEKKWITDWYDQTAVVNKVSERLSKIFDRETIIRVIADTLMETIELKSVNCVVGVPDEEMQVRAYKLVDYAGGELETEAPIIQYFLGKQAAVALKAFPKDLKKAAKELGFEKHSMFLPLHSPETLEGVIVLGPRISEAKYNDKDYELFKTILNIGKVFMERMKPYAKLEDNYQKSLVVAEKASFQATFATLTKQIAHEIRNPMAMLLSSAEIVEDDIDDKEEVLRFSGIVKTVVNRIIGITETMMKYGKAESTERELMDVHEVITEAVTLAKGECLRRSIALEKILEEGLPKVNVDAFRLTQVLINLFMNGIEAIGERGELVIKTSSSSFVNKEGNKTDAVKIEISDTGQGMTPEQAKRIFDPFFTTKYKNTGLGLSIVLKVVDDHGGTIDAISTPGEGTVFIIFLPVPS